MPCPDEPGRLGCPLRTGAAVIAAGGFRGGMGIAALTARGPPNNEIARELDSSEVIGESTPRQPQASESRLKFWETAST